MRGWQPPPLGCLVTLVIGVPSHAKVPESCFISAALMQSFDRNRQFTTTSLSSVFEHHTAPFGHVEKVGNLLNPSKAIMVYQAISSHIMEPLGWIHCCRNVTRGLHHRDATAGCWRAVEDQLSADWPFCGSCVHPLLLGRSWGGAAKACRACRACSLAIDWLIRIYIYIFPWGKTCQCLGWCVLWFKKKVKEIVAFASLPSLWGESLLCRCRSYVSTLRTHVTEVSKVTKAKEHQKVRQWLIALWLFNIAMENDPFLVDFPIKKKKTPFSSGILHGYVSHNQMVVGDILGLILWGAHSHCAGLHGLGLLHGRCQVHGRWLVSGPQLGTHGTPMGWCLALRCLKYLEVY